MLPSLVLRGGGWGPSRSEERTHSQGSSSHTHTGGHGQARLHLGRQEVRVVARGIVHVFACLLVLPDGPLPHFILCLVYRCTYNGETDPLKPGKPIAFKVRWWSIFCSGSRVALTKQGVFLFFHHASLTHITHTYSLYTQELRKLWDSRDMGGLFGPDNTLLIDDSTYKVRGTLGGIGVSNC